MTQKKRKKLTYTLKQLRQEYRRFAIYAGRTELMCNQTTEDYRKFQEKCAVYSSEKGLTKETHL